MSSTVDGRVDNSDIGKVKIAILGGGIGALTAAFYLTSEPYWKDRYDITVYQLGWRLGGKGASGRTAYVEDDVDGTKKVIDEEFVEEKENK